MKLIPLSELFDLEYGHQLDLNKMRRTNSPEGIAFVNRTARKNGVVAIVERIPQIEPLPSRSLTIALGGSVLSTFLQVKVFYTGQNVAVAYPKIPMTDAELLFYATAIRLNAFRYSTCGREANRTYKLITIPGFDSLPSWVNEANLTVFSGGDASSTSDTPILSDTKAWSVFSYNDLFRIKKGRRLTKADIKSGKVPFIGAIDKNNGLRQWTDKAIYEAGTITVPYNGNSVGEAFFQPSPYWATDDVNVLYPKFDMTPATALFICALIRLDKYRFNYGRKWSIERMKDSILKLPVDGKGNIDTDYIISFIEALPYSSQI